MEFISEISNIPAVLTMDDDLEITSQVRLDNNKRPDIQIKGRELLIIIEVKVESPADEDQLLSYKHELEKSSKTHKSLVFLTKYLEDVDTTLGVIPIRWYEVATRFTDYLAKEEDPLTRYVVNQFLDFLRERNMTMERITEEYVSGLRSLNNLMLMLENCLAASNLQSETTKGNGWTGYYFCGKKLFFGIYHSHPKSVAISIEKKMGKFSASSYANYQKLLGDTTFEKIDGGYRNTFSLTDSGFFSKETIDQISILTEFLKQSYEAVKKINSELWQ